MKSVVGVVGDFKAQNHTHLVTNRALEDAGLRFEWVPTPDLDAEAEDRLADYAGIWIAPASPFLSMDGALRAIRYARGCGVPLVGT